MHLYLIRHGIAEPRRSGQADGGRRLTEDGRSRVIREVKGLKRIGIQFDALWHSPLVRAVETAALLEPLVRGATRQTPLLAQSPTRQLLELVRDGGDDVALVGHEPWLGELLAMLCLKEAARAVPIPLKKGGVAIVEGEPAAGRMTLRALLPPRLLRRI